jgi:hypothetical protein
MQIDKIIAGKLLDEINVVIVISITQLNMKLTRN